MAKIDKIIDNAQPAPVEESLTQEGGQDSIALESVSETVRTVEDALKKADVDETLWEIERFVVNSWEVGMKLGNAATGFRVVTKPLWQVKVWLRTKRGWTVPEMRQLIMDDAKSVAPNYRRIVRPKRSRPENLLAELSIFDHHFGKLAWKPESGDNYDLKIAERRYMNAAADLLARAERLDVSRILFVVGNDFLHVDQGASFATTRGTVQDCDGRWQKAFRVGLRCAVQVTDMARNIAPVDVQIVSGNHDAEKVFCLGEALAGRYHGAADVRVLNEPSFWQYYRFGVNLIGFNHGDAMNDRRIQQLPNTMASDRPADWAETTTREFHLGHFHSEKEQVWIFRAAQCVQKVVVRFLPSLCGTDAWHRRQNYKSPLAAELHLYDYTMGRYGYFSHSPDDAQPNQ